MKNWHIREEHTACGHRDWSGEYPVCYHEDSESQYCQEDTCPIKIESAFKKHLRKSRSKVKKWPDWKKKLGPIN